MKARAEGDPLPRGFALLGVALVIAGGGLVAASRLATAAKPAPRGDVQTQLALLQEQMKQLEKRVPGQSIAMTHVAYHFTNLWFAAAQQNWPLAAYYVGEVRSNLKTAVQARPVRDGPAGQVSLAGIADALDNTELTQLQKAVEGQHGEEFVRVYDETILVCHSCHEAVGKPYLRVARPRSPEVQVINFARAADPGDQPEQSRR